MGYPLYLHSTFYTYILNIKHLNYILCITTNINGEIL